MLRQRVRRGNLLEVIAQLPACLIAIEACTSAFYWQRQFERLGHAVKIISPQYVKPFVRKTTGTMLKRSAWRFSSLR